MDTANVNRLLVAKGAARLRRRLRQPAAAAVPAGARLRRRCTVGIIASATLLGSGVLTLAVGLHAHRYHYRTLLLAAAALMAATGLGFAAVTEFWPLLVIAIVGTLNPSSGDVSVFLPLEHAVLSRVVDDRQRTAMFARYSLVGTLVAAVGSLAAGVPAMHRRTSTGWPQRTSLQVMFVALRAARRRGGARLSRPAARARVDAPARRRRCTNRTERVYTLAALFSLDAFGGGFVVQSMVALWLYQRFELSLAAAGTIFFATGILTAVSYLVAVRIAERIGLVNTMVFTHLPANLCLVADSVHARRRLTRSRCSSFAAALSQMDVPTRSSYVMAIVTPEERPAAASITSVPRSLASAASPFLAG